MQKQTIWVDAKMARRLKITAAQVGSTMLELANSALMDYLKKVDGNVPDPQTLRIDRRADPSELSKD
jgi:hypothetical protein